jgi:hypothetical protein
VADEDAYSRGHEAGSAAGAVLQRLRQHDDHFKALNGSLDRVFAELHATRMELQRQGDRAEASAQTVVATALELKEAEAARRDRTWTPFAKLFAVLGAAAALAAVIGLVLAQT